MNVTEKIKKLSALRGWSEYRLVKETGLPASTVANIFHRNTIPSITTLEAICHTFGITLSQFFSEGNAISLSTEQSELLEHWSNITNEQRTLLLSLIKTM
ncbi:MAG: helix-turn-helix domain-containing protein [Oscillospiraceae bacterium]|nr:helix-turn-helix domain-containing protein [Oscillospiraceae bacterium]